MGNGAYSMYTRIRRLLQDYKPHTIAYIAHELQITYMDTKLALEECVERGLIQKQQVIFGDCPIELFSIPLSLRSTNTHPNQIIMEKACPSLVTLS